MQAEEPVQHETLAVNGTEMAQMMHHLRNNSSGKDIGKVMKEGGVLILEGKPHYYTAAPPWVFHVMQRGIHVDIGAWCREATAKASEFLESLDKQYNTQDAS